MILVEFNSEELSILFDITNETPFDMTQNILNFKMSCDNNTFSNLNHYLKKTN